MKRISSIIYVVLQFTWGILQNILGLLFFLILKITGHAHFNFHTAVVTRWDFSFSMGLGMWIFLGHINAAHPEWPAEELADRESQVLVHEFGHTIQSAVLGPLFMFVIAIPSTLWAFLPWHVRLRAEKKASYFDAYCESWASAWGEKVTGLKAVGREDM